MGSVLMLNDLFRSSFGAAFPLFANAMFTRLGINWGSSLSGFISCAFIPASFFMK
jgi:DHA1 family multidrug resistance protein-like MFS transporter